MPWAVMLHAGATGARGLALRDKFAITTIPALVLLDGEGAVLCRNAHEPLRDDPQGRYFPWQSTSGAPCIPQVEFDIVAHSRPDGASGGIPLRRPPGKPPPFGTVRPDSVLDPGDQGSAHLRRKTRDNDKERGKSSLVGSQVGASVVSQVGSQVGQEPRPRPAPLVCPTPALMTPMSKRKTAASETVLRPRPPPKPGARPSPKYCIQSSSSLGGDGSIQS